MSTAVLDIGKTHLKLLLFDEQGTIVAERQRANRSQPGPPWRHLDLEALEAWLIEGLSSFARSHQLRDFIAASHGSAGVLVDDDGPLLPAIDYEAEPPAEVLRDYARLVPPFPERGAGLLGGASHLGRQLLWMQRAFPDRLARARAFLALPQYVAWRLSGVAVAEWTMFGAQSHLWSPLRRDWTALVDRLGVGRLLGPMVAPGHALGPPLRRWGLPPTLTVRAGVHDSTANLYGYQRLGLESFTLLSTGTWIVGMSAATPAERLVEARSMGLTSDVSGRPIAGTLAMVGREHAQLAGPTPCPITPVDVSRVVAADIMVLPSLSAFDGVFPGSGGRGFVVGSGIDDRHGRTALATLYAALVSAVCLDLLAARETVVVDGGFAAEPGFASLLAALRPELRILNAMRAHGTARGAAALAASSPAVPGLDDATLIQAEAWSVPGLRAYAERWSSRVETHLMTDPAGR